MKEDNLNPSSERLLVEKLKLDEEDFAFLQQIRAHMRAIVEREKREKEEIYMLGNKVLEPKQTVDTERTTASGNR